MLMDKRRFLSCSAVWLAGMLDMEQAAAQTPASAKLVGGQRFFANRPAIPHRQAKTTALFRVPPGGYPNALATAPEGLWIAQQKISGSQRLLYDLPEPKDPTEVCWLVDWNGTLRKTVKTDSRGTAGVAWDGKYLWTGADNNEIEGIFKTDLNGRTISKHQIPLGMPSNGGACHGLLWQADKLWITTTRMNGILRVDPNTFEPEFYIPVNFPRSHGIAWDNGAIWIVIGNSNGANEKPEDYRGGLAKYDATTGRLLETIEFLPGSADPHGLTMHNGVLYSCDAGIHPGWPNNWSKTTGKVFRIDPV
jgi:streptogramin lyase